MKDSFLHYFGLWSAKDIRRVSNLLTSLDIRFKIDERETTQEVLENWHAWDPASPKPTVGYDLWVHEEDEKKVGNHVVTMFPERKFQDV